MHDMRSVKCSKCDGRGKLTWTSVDNGRCFRCAGAGTIEVNHAAVEANKLGRATTIRMASRALEMLASDDGSEGEYVLFTALALADADVIARATARYVAIGAGSAERAAHYVAAYRVSAEGRSRR